VLFRTSVLLGRIPSRVAHTSYARGERPAPTTERMGVREPHRCGPPRDSLIGNGVSGRSRRSAGAVAGDLGTRCCCRGLLPHRHPRMAR
jgi:hypothetical protein